MKCFQFSTGETTKDSSDDDAVFSRAASRVSWSRSLSVTSTSTTTTNDHYFSSSSRELSFSNRFGFGFGFGSDSRIMRDDPLRVFSFSELKVATRGFNRGALIGEGGFGSVFRGSVRVSGDDLLDVAVKQLNRHGFQGHKEWINEVSLLGVVKHPNLVKLVGYCAEDDERGIQRLLVYELMHNKSLEDHLFGRAPVHLPWLTRLKIAQDAARGLAYLHEEMDFQLIFRDFKASNILLDEDFNAKLSDFGLARLGPPEGLGHISTSVVGTVGYAAPEYVHTGRLTVKSDVWSFGVVLYELITGRRALERNLPKGEQKLLEWVKPYASDSKKFHLIIDPHLKGQNCGRSARKVAALANICLAKQPKHRPKMSQVVEKLENIIIEITSIDISGTRPVEETEELSTKEETIEETQTESSRPGQSSGYLRKVFDVKEIVNLRNRSIGKLDWRSWTPGVVKTWT